MSPELPILPPKYMEFIEYLLFDMECGGSASMAYRKAFPDYKYIQIWIKFLTQANLNRLLCSKEEHMAELAALREEARDAGNIPAAIQAELQRGKVSGHYIERKEIIHIREDDLTTLIELARNGRRDIAEEYAADLGLSRQLIEGLDGVYTVKGERGKPVPTLIPVADGMPPPPKPFTEM